jgi:hydroxyacylglutathione hydrolase
MVTLVKNTLFPSNTYIIQDGNSNECILIDPGLDYLAIEKKMQELKVVPTHILATHGHFDHVGSVSYFQKKYQAQFYLHEKDLKLLRTINFYLKMMKINMKVEVPQPDHMLVDLQETVIWRNTQFKSYNLPGHSSGSCVFHLDNYLFSGDTLYANGIGINPFPGQDKAVLKSSIEAIFNLFQDQVMVYPGHGKNATLGNIKKDNSELQQFLKQEVYE